MSGPPDFDALYRDDPDPWSLTTSDHERRKYARTVEALGDRRFARAFEPGCSVGVLTALLTDVCDEVVASDRSAVAVRLAAERAPRARVSVGAVPADWPHATFDLVVLSELLYYLDVDDRRAVLDRSVETLRPDGRLLLVHWWHPFAESYADGTTCHDEVHADPRLRRARHVPDPDHLIELFEVAVR